VSDERKKNAASSGRPLPARLDPRGGRPSRQGSAPDSRAAGRGRTAGAEGSRGRARAVVTTRAVAALVALVILATSGWGWYLGQVADASVNRTDAIPADGNTESGVREAMNLLLVGSDSRSRLTAEQLGQLNAGEDSGLNTDTMILVHVPADGSRASFVSFPRDSYVQIPGHGWDKLNAAYSLGAQGAPAGSDDAERQAAGAQLLIQTISGLTGLQIDHYAEVDLLGFFELSNVVGGVQVNLCSPARDSFSGVNLPAGVQTISGQQALAFVRQRHGLPRGDFDRIVRQQTFIAGMIRKMLSENVLLDLGKQRELVEAAAGSLTVDQSLDLFGLASQLQSVTADSIDFQTIPYVGDDEDRQGRYILRLQDEDTLHEFFADLSADSPATAGATPTAPQTVAPSTVTIDVLNGSGVPGRAGEAAGALEAAGFVIGDTGNADSSDHDKTVVGYAPGNEDLAATVAAAIPGAGIEESQDASSGTVQLVLGADFNGVGQAVDPAVPATATATAGEEARTAADTGCIN
jgi:LCP family protein required for cell wall assembly